MNLSEENQEQIKRFLDGVSHLRPALKRLGLHYLAIRKGDKFVLSRGIVFALVTPRTVPEITVQTTNLLAGRCELTASNLEAFIEQVLAGSLETPAGPVMLQRFPDQRKFIEDVPFHPEGLKSQGKLHVLRFSGINPLATTDHVPLDWEVRGAERPYGNLQEVANDVGVGPLAGGDALLEFAVPQAVAVDQRSHLKGEEATVRLNLAFGLECDKASLGYCVIGNQGITARERISGGAVKWVHDEQYQTSEITVAVPRGSAVQFIASYAGKAQHYWWLTDPATSLNPLRAVHAAFDPDLAVLKEFLFRTAVRARDARDFEFGVAWLLSMLGFRVAQLGGNDRTSDAADLIASTPSGNVAVVECTTGMLKVENKLALLVERAERVKRALADSGSRHLRVIPVMAASKPREELRAELDQAERAGVLVLCREDLDRLLGQTVVLPNTDRMFDEAFGTVLSQQNRVLSSK